MAWSMEGLFFENCSCDAVCPCTWSNLAHRATNDYCHFALVFQVEQGNIDGVDVAGCSFVVAASTPPQMADGNWKVGLIVDDGCAAPQAEAIGRVVSGEAGGVFAALGPLVGEFLGVEQRPIRVEVNGNEHHVTVGDVIDFTGTKVVTDEGAAVELTNIVVHPAGPTLGIAPVSRASNSPFGISWSGSDLSGFANRFSWAA
jgi:hypothetical protein